MRIERLNIKGYRPFRDFTADMGPIEVIVGSNGAGKSSLFEFLRFMRDSVYQDIPPEIVAGSIGQQLFHIPGPERFQWMIEIDNDKPIHIIYSGELSGPLGKIHIAAERVESAKPLPGQQDHFIYLSTEGQRGLIQDEAAYRYGFLLSRSNQLALSTAIDPQLATVFGLREYMREWRFYSAFSINSQKIRKSVPIEQEPALHEDGGNLSSVLHYLMTEHRDAFEELQQHLRSVVPGFGRLSVKARGGPGEVIAFWSEKGVDTDLSLADLSDGSLRLLCWITLCVLPKPPTLLCIDEPDQGVHPRTLPVLAGLLQKAARRTQILLATHASYFLMQFDFGELAIIRKVDGCAEFVKPMNSRILLDNLEDFGIEELEAMHRSDELESLA